MSDVDADDLKREIEDAIGTVLNRHETALITKWIVLVEAIDGDGDRCLWTLGSDTLTKWDGLGILTYGLQLEQAKAVARYLEPDE
jgi:hypothetical protein